MKPLFFAYYTKPKESCIKHRYVLSKRPPSIFKRWASFKNRRPIIHFSTVDM